MFVIQGIAVCIYFKEMDKTGTNKLCFSGIILCLFGFMGISLLVW